MSLAARSSAFHTAVREPFAMIRSASLTGSLRSDSTETYVSNYARTHSHSRRSSSVTRLQFRDAKDDSTTVERGWFRNIFSPLPEESRDEQEVVDEYLEFLDRRYRRLHSDEKEEKSTPFSAMNWLMQGKNRNEVLLSQQKQEDALYALGVAGLASEKLLQKHSLPVDTTAQTASPTVQAPLFSDVIDVTDVSQTTSSLIIQKVFVPIIRVLYITQRRKELFVSSQLRRVLEFLSIRAKTVTKSLIRGPRATAKAIIEFGGGKENITLTLTAVYTVMLLLRPVLQAAMAESSVTP